MRYPRRPWYHPLTMMASEPAGYVLSCFGLGIAVFYPFRFRIADYFERQSSCFHEDDRLQAIMFYLSLDAVHRRQAYVLLPNASEDMATLRTENLMMTSGLRHGQIDYEYAYWVAHQRDAVRAEELLNEVNALKQRIAAQGDDNHNADVDKDGDEEGSTSEVTATA